MKKLTGATVIVSMMVFLLICGNLYAAETSTDLLETFSKHAEGIHEGLDGMCEIYGEALEEGKLDKSALSNVIKKIRENAVKIVALGKKHKKEFRIVHRWIGRFAILSFLVTVFFGLFAAGVL